MTVELLSEQHLGFLSLKGGCTGSFECTVVKMSHCWKSHVAAHMLIVHVQMYVTSCIQKVSEYDQEITQSHSIDQQTAS